MTKGHYHHHIEEATGEPVEEVQRVNHLPTRLRVLRAQKGLTQAEAADNIGIGRDTLSGLERGRHHPFLPTLAKISKAYGVPVEELIEETTVIEIGEPYPEELDPELHEFNRLTKRIADLALAYSKSQSGAVMFCWLDLKEALGEYEKMVSGE